MVLCPNDHENLEGLSHCRVCGIPLLDLSAEFDSLVDSLACRAKMGRPSPNTLLVGLGTVGSRLIDIYGATYGDHNTDYSYLAIDTAEVVVPTGSDGILRLTLGDLTPSTGTFCGIGETVIRQDPHLLPIFRKAGLNHLDENQVAFFVTCIGGGIGSATSVLVEKCHQLNPNCKVVALIVVPGSDESFHNHLNAYYGLSHLLENGNRQAADLIIAVQYDRMKTLRAVGTGGQELNSDSLVAALSNLLMKNLSSQYMAEVIRINLSMGVKIVVPCLAIGHSIEIFGSLANILESAIGYPANQVSRQAVLTCHLLLRVPKSLTTGFTEEIVNEQLWALVRRHLPGVKAASSSITTNEEQDDRVEVCILLGGDSATGALFSNDISLLEFKEEVNRQICWQTYGLDKESMKLASDRITQYDSALDLLRDGRRVKKVKTKQAYH